MTTELQTERVGATQIMTLVGPATRNALSPQVYAAGIETLNMAESNDEVRAVILTGAGDHFCGGGDLQRLTHNRQHDLPKVAEHIDAFHQWIEALRSFPKPVIAAVEGVAAGGGLSLVLACDLVVAAENARFVSAYSQVGLSPDGGASWHLARALGRGPALQLLWQSTPISAQEMAHWGVVHQVTPAGTALEQALIWAEQLAQAPSGALASIKELVNEAPTQTLRQQLDAEKQHFMVNLLRPEAGQAIENFLNRKG
ncbi:oxepin-CoA hydrolase, alternative type [Aquabacterium sp.]|uniref:oxepin-CoA hydrolase, alternative type n=1 Tax=Aquabacterium sp. TaxID=1872578 RepID=UPI0024875C81|nr:enoyl-CoA hydratase [Aquabacterium sp.]MDI1260336.1 enoyl-CoA hydratase [Aquabacterium sp.]